MRQDGGGAKCSSAQPGAVFDPVFDKLRRAKLDSTAFGSEDAQARRELVEVRPKGCGTKEQRPGIAEAVGG
jgi:hypothetical protein